MTRINLLFIWRSPLPNEVFFARRTGFPLSLLLVPIAVICIGAYLFTTERNADFRDDPMAAPLSADERSRWSYFHEEVDGAKQVQTLDDAFPALMNIRNSVSHIPYRDELHRLDANCCLDTAKDHLTACQMGGRIHPHYWRTELTKALDAIPKYTRRLDNTPPPPTIDVESESLLPTISL